MNTSSLRGFSLRPIRPNDAQVWTAYACLPEVKLHTSSTAASVDDIRRKIDKTLSGDVAAPIRLAIVKAAGAAELVAPVGFLTISPLNGTAEVTYDVTPAHWRQSIASAACRAATLWGFAQRGWHRIQATSVLPNIGSQKMLERCGFPREGLLRNFRLVRGQQTDFWMYAAMPGDIKT
ncbi:GNAT family protein [Paucibacter sp. PLA-PC-4]|uniref:GNAT family N-acetyltransferase n=1 Tax=Paucibacter sp. PLA-PC-4 TaxID=2993655 RepID=UPI00224AA425|nr:GNAT family protein [Paucibacter sp. PLA-PC-4]MCX2864667.1 GNAT family protein [Paucibacter sp. PLA-PC-4]